MKYISKELTEKLFSLPLPCTFEVGKIYVWLTKTNTRYNPIVIDLFTEIFIEDGLYFFKYVNLGRDGVGRIERGSFNDLRYRRLEDFSTDLLQELTIDIAISKRNRILR